MVTQPANWPLCLCLIYITVFLFSMSSRRCCHLIFLMAINSINLVINKSYIFPSHLYNAIVFSQSLIFTVCSLLLLISVLFFLTRFFFVLPSFSKLHCSGFYGRCKEKLMQKRGEMGQFVLNDVEKKCPIRLNHIIKSGHQVIHQAALGSIRNTIQMQQWNKISILDMCCAVLWYKYYSV